MSDPPAEPTEEEKLAVIGMAKKVAETLAASGLDARQALASLGIATALMTLILRMDDEETEELMDDLPPFVRIFRSRHVVSDNGELLADMPIAGSA